MTEYNVNPKKCWMETYTGKHFYPYDPKAEDIDIVDIAHHLSLLCRYTGACREFYSVAQHSVLAMHIVSKKDMLATLLHDSPETYLNDISSPVKHSMHYYKEVENKILSVIYEKYDVNHYDESAVKKADNILLMTEARDLMHDTDGWEKPEEPLPDIIIPWTSKRAEKVFLNYFYELCKNS